jgi:hypothetical protein
LIPVADLAFYKVITERIVAAIESATFVWNDKNYARQALATSAGQKSIALPGMSIYRTATEIEQQRYTTGQVARGELSHRGDTDYIRERAVPVIATYECVGFSKTIDDRNDFERELWFNDVLTALNCVIILDQDIKIEANFAVVGDPTISYDQTNVEKTGRTIFYEVGRTFRVYGQWAKLGQEKLIKEILARFYNGDTTVLDQITIT